MKDAIADTRLEQGAPLQREVAGGPAIERLSLFAQLHLGEKTEATGIDPEHGNMSRSRLLRRPEQGAVAADAADQAGAVQGIDQGARALLRRPAVVPVRKTALHKPEDVFHHR